jgi:hypothetical protein
MPDDVGTSSVLMAFSGVAVVSGVALSRIGAAAYMDIEWIKILYSTAEIISVTLNGFWN